MPVTTTRVMLVLAAIGVQLAGSPELLVSQTPDRVWVNTRSGVYHCPGTTYYGRTARGLYLVESTAREKGYRANGGQACAPQHVAPRDTMPTPFMGAVPAGDDRGPRSPAKPTEECTITRVVDADTIRCSAQGSVRLIGIDSPESDQRPFGPDATAALVALLPPHAVVQLEADEAPREPSGSRRYLSYVWYRGEMLNWRLVRDGWAVAVKYPPNVRYAALLDVAEGRARADNRGLWRHDGFRCRPRAHRLRQC